MQEMEWLFVSSQKLTEKSYSSVYGFHTCRFFSLQDTYALTQILGQQSNSSITPLSRQRLPLVKFNLLGVGVPKDVLNALLSMLLVGRCERVPKFESFVVFACCDLIRDKLVATDTASCLQNVSHLLDLGASVFISVLLSTTFHKKLYLFLIY